MEGQAYEASYNTVLGNLLFILQYDTVVTVVVHTMVHRHSNHNKCTLHSTVQYMVMNHDMVQYCTVNYHHETTVLSTVR